jgi:hypothetical protein
MKIKNWKKFQHFKDRRPPWIKLYRDILDDVEWHELDAQSSKILVMLWLIASEDENGILPSVKALSFRLRTSETSIKSTISKLSHWLDHDDIVEISCGYQDDLPETETETEKEKEKEKEQRKEKTQRASRLPQDWQPNDRMLAFCENERPDLNPTEVSATFRDYWHSQAGQKGVKADWEATWRNWVRNQRMAAKSPQRAAIGYRSQNELVAAELIAELKNG